MKKIKKTTNKHLVLDSETIRDLRPYELMQVAGGDRLSFFDCSAHCTSTCPQ